MGKYGLAAIRAFQMLDQKLVQSPQEAWEHATSEVFDTTSSQDKGCPRGTFLGLCQEGLIRGISPGEYTKSKDNLTYAVNAVALLKETPSLAEHEDELWSKVGGGKKANSQMDVVISLWKKGVISE